MTIVLIGPQRAGKTTVGRLLAAALDEPFVDLKAVARQYWNELDYDPAEAARRYNTRRFDNAYRYLWPFQAHAVARGLADHPGSVIELDALQSVYEDEAHFAQVQDALRTYARQVILLLPSPDLDDSIHVLRQRERVLIDGQEIIEYFVRHPANASLAKHTLYTAGKTPQAACDELLSLIDPAAPEIILIGPPDTGKSTLGELLSRRLVRPRASVDRLRKVYYAEVGYDERVEQHLRMTEGFEAVVRYWKPFDLHAVGRTLKDHPGHVIDFGAGHSVYDDPGDMARLRALLAPYPNVILLLPSPDPAESVAILHDRIRLRTGIDGVELNRYLLTSPCNQRLATQVVYTQDKTPQQVRDEILQFH